MTRPVSVVISASEMPSATSPMVLSPPEPEESAPNVASMPGHRAEQPDERRGADADLHHAQVALEGAVSVARSCSEEETAASRSSELRAVTKSSSSADRALALGRMVDPPAPGLLGDGEEALLAAAEVHVHAHREHHQRDDRRCATMAQPPAQPDVDRLLPQRLRWHRSTLARFEGLDARASRVSGMRTHRGETGSDPDRPSPARAMSAAWPARRPGRPSGSGVAEGDRGLGTTLASGRVRAMRERATVESPADRPGPAPC